MENNTYAESFPSTVSKEKFRQYTNKLLNECFIVKSCADTKAAYYFLLKEKEIVRIFFDFLGYEVTINEELGVIAIDNTYGTGRIRLRIIDSIVLLIFRLIYIEQRKKLSRTERVIIEADEVYDRYKALKGDRLKKQDAKIIFGMLRRYHIIDNLDTDISDVNTRIEIYPSVVLTLNINELGHIYDESIKKLNTYTNGGEKDNADEEDFDQA